ncbi:recombinase family protein [Mycobacterium sp.]|uniref:recombinase family protein n=1 Tax=Mycobacterium sp. TaxID=1785 RepID=UPI003C73820F
MDQLQARERDPAGPDPAAPVRVRALLRRVSQKRAVLYIRVSTDEQSASIEAQRETCTRLANQHDLRDCRRVRGRKR